MSAYRLLLGGWARCGLWPKEAHRIVAVSNSSDGITAVRPLCGNDMCWPQATRHGVHCADCERLTRVVRKSDWALRFALSGFAPEEWQAVEGHETEWPSACCS